MKVNAAHIETYKKAMGQLDFMQPFVEEPDVFNSESVKFRNFLIQSFAHLNSDFHYLSFLNEDDVNQELIKVAGILQILPVNAKHGTKIFENMSENDVQRFWQRFFSLFNDQPELINVNSSLNMDYESNVEFFKSLSSTMNYLNYNFPVINQKKLKNTNINEEIKKWNEKINVNETFINMNDTTFSDYEIEHLQGVDIEQLIKDMKHVTGIYEGINFSKQENEYKYCNFFSNFTLLAKDILKYKTDLNVINSTELDNTFYTSLSKNKSYWSDNLYFWKRYNNHINILKSKIKLLE